MAFQQSSFATQGTSFIQGGSMVRAAPVQTRQQPQIVQQARTMQTIQQPRYVGQTTVGIDVDGDGRADVLVQEPVFIQQAPAVEIVQTRAVEIIQPRMDPVEQVVVREYTRPYEGPIQQASAIQQPRYVGQTTVGIDVDGDGRADVLVQEPVFSSGATSYVQVPQPQIVQQAAPQRSVQYAQGGSIAAQRRPVSMVQGASRVGVQNFGSRQY